MEMAADTQGPSDKTYYVARTKDNGTYDKRLKVNILADDAIRCNTYLFYLYKLKIIFIKKSKHKSESIQYCYNFLFDSGPN